MRVFQVSYAFLYKMIYTNFLHIKLVYSDPARMAILYFRSIAICMYKPSRQIACRPRSIHWIAFACFL
jgi:hypothetical protein